MRPPPRSVELTQVTEWSEGNIHSVQDSLAAEEPLEIRIDGSPLTVTMRTPGHDLELAAGFLLTEGIIDSRDQLAGIRALTSDALVRSNVVEVQLVSQSSRTEDHRRNFVAGSGCGICGKASIESVRRRGMCRPKPGFRVNPEALCRLPEILRAEQAVFDRTGGLHAAALFDAQGNLVVLREDIGRHNAVDKLIGWSLLHARLPLDDSVLLVSGRGGFEIIQKAIAAGVPIVVCVSAPSALAVKLAREFGLTLIGFLRGQRFVIYSGSSRCLPNIT